MRPRRLRSVGSSPIASSPGSLREPVRHVLRTQYLVFRLRKAFEVPQESRCEGRYVWVASGSVGGEPALALGGSDLRWTSNVLRRRRRNVGIVAER